MLFRSHKDWEVCGEAVDGQDAIQKSRQLAPDVIVLDFSMPRVNGIEAALQISEICPHGFDAPLLDVYGFPTRKISAKCRYRGRLIQEQRGADREQH